METFNGQLKLRRFLSIQEIAQKSFKNHSIELCKSASINNIQTSTSYNDDLEWDKYFDFTKHPESENVSVYDVNERMTDIIKLTFLDFDFVSRSVSCNSISINTYSREPIHEILKVQLSTLESYCLQSPCQTSDFIYKPFIYQKNSFMDDSNRKISQISQISQNHSKSFYRSMPDIRMMKVYRKSSLEELDCGLKNAKHMSLLDFGCFEFIDLKKLKNESSRNRKLMKLNLDSNNSLIKISPLMDNVCKKSMTKKVSLSGSSVNFSTLSRLSKLKSYVNDLSEKIVNIISSSLNLTKPKFEASNILNTICEETICSYDIIEFEDIMETPSEGG